MFVQQWPLNGEVNNFKRSFFKTSIIKTSVDVWELGHMCVVVYWCARVAMHDAVRRVSAIPRFRRWFLVRSPLL